MAFPVNSTKHIKNTFFTNSFQAVQQEKTCPTTFYKATTSMLPKRDRYHNKNKDTTISPTDRKYSRKILANQIERYMKIIIHHD